MSSCIKENESDPNQIFLPSKIEPTVFLKLGFKFFQFFMLFRGYPGHFGFFKDDSINWFEISNQF